MGMEIGMEMGLGMGMEVYWKPTGEIRGKRKWVGKEKIKQ